MNIEHFTDDRIEAICAGAALTTEERTFLIDDTPRFEECSRSSDELASMSDRELMDAAYSVWADYARCMY